VEAVEVGFGGLLQGADVGDTGVVDEDVDAAKGFYDLTDGSDDAGLIGDVAGVNSGCAPGLGDGALRFAGALYIDVEDADAGAFAGESDGDAPPDAGAAAGYEGDFAGKTRQFGILDFGLVDRSPSSPTRHPEYVIPNSFTA